MEDYFSVSMRQRQAIIVSSDTLGQNSIWSNRKVIELIISFFGLKLFHSYKSSKKPLGHQHKNYWYSFDQNLLYNMVAFSKQSFAVYNSHMSLIYSLVAKDQQVLADFTKHTGNFHHSAIEVLQKTPSSRQFGQVVAAQYTYYTSAKDGFVFLVLVDSTYELRIAFSFLRKIQEEFFAKYDEETRRAAVAHSLQDFKPILHKWTDKYENKAQVDKLMKLKGELTEVEKMTLRNLDKITDRGEILAVIVENSKDLSVISYDMVDLAKESKRRLWWKKTGLKIAIGVIGIVVVALVVLFVIL